MPARATVDEHSRDLNVPTTHSKASDLIFNVPMIVKRIP